MYTDLHTDFILTPIKTILDEGVNACQSLPSGIESFPISEYHFQSLFLRMTGASEQKMKCIFWQMATDDVQYRYKYLNYQGIGECSTYASKNVVFKDLIAQICKKNPNFCIQSLWDDFKYDAATVASERTKWEDKVKASRQKQINHIIQKRIDSGHPMSQEDIERMTSGIMGNAMKEDDFKNHLSSNKRRARVAQILESLFETVKNTNLAVWRTADLVNYHKYCQKIIKGCEVAEAKGDGANLFCGSLVGLYERLVYQHRNRTAHNTVAYQKNLPALETLSSKNYHLSNYFFRFAIILVMDEVFVKLYQKYLEVLN